MNNQTIAAVATPSGGALGIIRISGSEAISIASRIFIPYHGLSLAHREAGTVTFGKIVDSRGYIVDEVLASLFRSPHSFTGEDSIEFSCHGSQFIMDRIMRLLLENGCRGAQPGEYTRRAFLNGKMDLSQAEAVADLIASKSAAEHRMAINQMKGGFSRELKKLRDKLLHITSLMELELDFSDHEELEFADRGELRGLAEEIRKKIDSLTDSFRAGNAIKNGVPVAIIGETNAGKSTLLNLLLGEDKAIVSDIHGTTRDVIEDTINIKGTTYRFVDTAGIRHTDDTIESIGIERSIEQMNKADIVLWLVDCSGHGTDELLKKTVIGNSSDARLIILFNKSEELTQESRDALISKFSDIHATKLFISAKYNKGIDKLLNLLSESINLGNISSGDVIVSNLRHYEALVKAGESIRRAEEAMDMGLSGDLVSEDLRQCIFFLSDIVGEVTTEDVLGNIFKNFCVGK